MSGCDPDQAAAMADGVFPAGSEMGAVKAVMRRLQKGAHKRETRASASGRAASVSRGKGGLPDTKKKGTSR